MKDSVFIVPEFGRGKHFRWSEIESYQVKNIDFADKQNAAIEYRLKNGGVLHDEFDVKDDLHKFLGDNGMVGRGLVYVLRDN